LLSLKLIRDFVSTCVHTIVVKTIKGQLKDLPYLYLSIPQAFKIVETDASDIGYGGIIKQKISGKE